MNHFKKYHCNCWSDIFKLTLLTSTGYYVDKPSSGALFRCRVQVPRSAQPYPGIFTIDFSLALRASECLAVIHQRDRLSYAFARPLALGSLAFGRSHVLLHPHLNSAKLPSVSMKTQGPWINAVPPRAVSM